MSKRLVNQFGVLALLGSLLLVPGVAAGDADPKQPQTFIETIGAWLAHLVGLDSEAVKPSEELDERCTIDPWGCPTGS